MHLFGDDRTGAAGIILCEAYIRGFDTPPSACRGSALLSRGRPGMVRRWLLALTDRHQPGSRGTGLGSWISSRWPLLAALAPEQAVEIVARDGPVGAAVLKQKTGQ